MNRSAIQMHSMHSLRSHYGLVVTAITSIALAKLNLWLIQNPYGMPDKFRNDTHKFWKWRNITISFIHSLLSAFAGLLALSFEPLLALNMIDSYSELAYLVLCFSNGYFVYDLILSLMNISYPGRLEIIVHHILTVSCLAVSTVSKRFMGYCMTALVVEISNIFLHLRQLFAMVGIDAKSKTYRTNSIITIISLIIWRLFPISWIIFCLYMEDDSIGFWYWLLSSACALVILVVSVGIIVRVALKDFIVLKKQ